MFLAVIGIFWLCLVKFHRARLSALRQVPSCSHAMLRRIGKHRIPSVKSHRGRLSALRQVPSCSCAMLRRVGKYWIPSVKFHRIVRVYLSSVIFFMFFRNDLCYFVLFDSSVKCREK